MQRSEDSFVNPFLPNESNKDRRLNSESEPTGGLILTDGDIRHGERR